MNKSGFIIRSLVPPELKEKISADTKKDKITCYLDCPSVSIQKWADSLKKIMKDLSGVEIVCEHKADSKYISVGAASIIAKCIREKEMDKLKEKYGTEVYEKKQKSYISGGRKGSWSIDFYCIHSDA
jgi:ribonuclease HII